MMPLISPMPNVSTLSKSVAVGRPIGIDVENGLLYIYGIGNQHVSFSNEKNIIV